MNRKKILVVSPEFPPLTNWGGIATFSKNIAILVSKLGYEVDVITFDGVGKKSQNVNTAYGTVRYIPLNFENSILNFLYFTFPFGLIRKLIKFIFPNLLLVLEWNLFFYIYIKKHYKNSNKLLIHSPSYQFPTLLYGLLNKSIPQIVHIHGMQSQLNKYEAVVSFELKIFTFLESFYIQKISSSVIACSKNIYNFLINNEKYKNTNISYIANFFDVKNFANDMSINVNNIVYFGRLEMRKGVDLLIKSFIKLGKKNKKLKLFLIGEDRPDCLYQGSLITYQELVRILTLNNRAIYNRIFFLPNISKNNSLVEVLSKIKGIAVFPSYYEPFGYTTVEAMAMGFITIASDSGGGKEIIENGINGFLTKPNVYDLSKAINLVSNLKLKEIKIITDLAFQSVAKKYSIESQLKQYKNLYSSFFN